MAIEAREEESAERDGRKECRGRRLPSIFDGLPAGRPLDLEALASLMRRDGETRILAALDRLLAREGRATGGQPAAG